MYKLAALLCFAFIQTAYAKIEIDTVCAAKWPEPTVQQYYLRKAVGQTSPKAVNITVEVTASGLAAVTFTTEKGVREKVIVAFEFMSPACVTSEPYKLADNPLLFRVLSYTK